MYNLPLFFQQWKLTVVLCQLLPSFLEVKPQEAFENAWKLFIKQILHGTQQTL